MYMYMYMTCTQAHVLPPRWGASQPEGLPRSLGWPPAPWGCGKAWVDTRVSRRMHPDQKSNPSFARRARPAGPTRPRSESNAVACTILTHDRVIKSIGEFLISIISPLRTRDAARKAGARAAGSAAVVAAATPRLATMEVAAVVAAAAAATTAIAAAMAAATAAATAASPAASSADMTGERACGRGVQAAVQGMGAGVRGSIRTFVALLVVGT